MRANRPPLPPGEGRGEGAEGNGWPLASGQGQSGQRAGRSARAGWHWLCQCSHPGDMTEYPRPLLIPLTPTLSRRERGTFRKLLATSITAARRPPTWLPTSGGNTPRSAVRTAAGIRSMGKSSICCRSRSGSSPHSCLIRARISAMSGRCVGMCRAQGIVFFASRPLAGLRAGLRTGLSALILAGFITRAGCWFSHGHELQGLQFFCAWVSELVQRGDDFRCASCVAGPPSCRERQLQFAHPLGNCQCGFGIFRLAGLAPRALQLLLHGGSAGLALASSPAAASFFARHPARWSLRSIGCPSRFLSNSSSLPDGSAAATVALEAPTSSPSR